MIQIEPQRSPVFIDAHSDRLYDVCVALAAELWVLSERQTVVERLLGDTGVVTSEQLAAAPIPSDSGARQAFIERLFGALAPADAVAADARVTGWTAAASSTSTT